MPKRLIILMLLGAGAGAGGCGGADEAPERARRAPAKAAGPADTRCAELRTRRAARRLARQLVDRVVAPEEQAERETIATIGESLYATCRQPRLPGVENPADYRPVRPVLAELQREFDEHEIEGH